MPLPLIAAGIAAGAGLLQTGLGIADKIKGKKTRDKAQSFFEENKFAIPESAKASLSSAQRQASGVRLPAEDLRRAQIAEATSGGLGAAQQAATSSSDVLSVLSGLYGGQQRAEQNMAVEGAERFDRNQSMLRSELGRMADWEKQKWDYNVLYPYQQQMQTAAQLSQRGTQGIGQGLSTIGSAAAGYSQLSSAEAQNNAFMQQMGFGTSQPTMAGAQAQLAQSRQNLPSYSMNYQDPLRTQLLDIPFTHPR